MNVSDLIIDREIPTGTINGSNQVFVLSKPPDPEKSLQLTLNGILQTVGEDYSIVDVNITFMVAPPVGSILFADYRHSLIIISTSKIGDVNGSSLENDEDWTDDSTANLAKATADGKIVTFLQDEAPTAEGAGDLWIDTNDGNKLYRWSGTSWAEVQDSDIAQAIVNAATAQATADSKTDDTAADAAQATADGKIVTFFQSEAPTAEGAGDLWIDTNDDNKPYRWSGSAWVAIDNPVSDWSLIVDDDNNKPADNATENTGDLADQDTVDSDHLDLESVLDTHIKHNGLFERHDLPLESIDGWDNSDFGITVNVGSLLLETGTALNTFRYAHAATYAGIDFLKEMIARWRLKWYNSTNQLSYAYIGFADDSSKQAFGFKVLNGTLYAFWQTGAEEDTTEYTQEITGITITNFNMYRVEYSPGTSIKFFVNDVLKHTATTNLPNTTWGNDEVYSGFSIKNTETVTKRLLITQVYFLGEN